MFALFQKKSLAFYARLLASINSRSGYLLPRRMPSICVGSRYSNMTVSKDAGIILSILAS